MNKRLTEIFSALPKCNTFADIGCDHGYLAIYLKQNNIAKTVIATDIGEKPLKSAQKNVAEANVSGIDLRLCDGLSGINPNETDTIIIAGMGGEVISGLIERGKNVAARESVTLILQPTTSPEFLRRFLYSNGYEILAEIPVFENGKVYSVMKVQFIQKTNIKLARTKDFDYIIYGHFFFYR